MEQRKIPILNENLDLPLLFLVFKKSILIFLIIFLIAGAATYAYLRYTRPLFQSSSTIQLKDETNTTRQLLNLQGATHDDFNANQTIELIKSREFLKRVVSRLPLDISYYSQGTFMVNELYRASPYEVLFRNDISSLYNKEIGVEFIDEKSGTIFMLDNKQGKNMSFNSGEWFNFFGTWLNINVVLPEVILERDKLLKKDDYYFIINDEGTLLSYIINKLSVYVLNYEARTIQIMYNDYNARKTAEIVNTISHEFLIYEVEKKKESAQKILNFIDMQTETIYSELDKIEEQLYAFRQENQIRSEGDKSMATFQSNIERVSKLSNQIEDVELEIATYSSVLQYITNDSLSYIEFIAFIPQRINSQIFSSILNEIQQLIKEKEKLLNNLTPQSFQIVSIENQITNQKRILIEYANASLNRAHIRKEYLVEQLFDWEKRTYSSVSGNDLEYSKIQRLYNVNIEFFNNILGKKAEYLISQAGFVSQNVILENASVPHGSISPRKYYSMLIAVIVASLLSFIILFFRYLFHNEIYSVQDIRNYTDVPIIGTIPSFKDIIPISKVLVDIKPNSVFSEAFRNIRSNLEFIDKEEGGKIITLSSTISGEGKTFIALNLGGVYAFQGKKVILLDFDLRRPRIHQSFQVENKIGVSTLLIGKSTLENSIRKSSISNFDYVTAGPIPPNPSELVKNSSVKELIKTLQGIYDIIIIDTPPIGLVTDALELFKLSDYQIYVLKSNYSKRVFLYNINHLFHEKGFSKLSVVLNKIDMSSSSMFGSYSHYYGYGYYSYESKSIYQEDAAKYFKRGFFSFLRRKK